ncbi:MAG: hypothetical protein IJ324_07080 [Lachnospiraceae bacterium]|nr:hypothetical protein [Lachnospiraceae bacterium]
MKKKVNINFILVIVLVAAMMLVPIVLGVAYAELNSEMVSLKSSMDATLESNDEIEDVEGYGLIAESIGYGFGAFAGILVLAMIIIVAGYALLLFVFALIARLVFAREGKRLLAYRILMGIDYVLQVGLVLFLGEMLLGEFNVGPLVLMLLVLAGLVYSARNTYTKRICE